GLSLRVWNSRDFIDASPILDLFARLHRRPSPARSGQRHGNLATPYRIAREIRTCDRLLRGEEHAGLGGLQVNDLRSPDLGEARRLAREHDDLGVLSDIIEHRPETLEAGVVGEAEGVVKDDG